MSESIYFLATGDDERPLPSGFTPKLLGESGGIIGYREGKIVWFDDGDFREVGSGEVYDCNCEGTIVGSTIQNDKAFPCSWTVDGIKWIGDNPGVATAINNLGDILIVETEDFCEYVYNEEEPFEIAMPQSRSFCISGEEKIPLLGLDGQASRVKAMDIDNNRRIVGYSLHSSPELEAHHGSEYGIPYFGGAAGHRPLLWTRFVASDVPGPKYSIGAIGTLLGPRDTILGYFTEGAGDIPTSSYVDFVDNAFWSRGGDSMRLDSVIWGTCYMSCVHGINESGHILVSNPSCQELVLLVESHAGEEDYLSWLNEITAFAKGTPSPAGSNVQKEEYPMSIWSNLRRKRT